MATAIALIIGIVVLGTIAAAVYWLALFVSLWLSTHNK